MASKKSRMVTWCLLHLEGILCIVEKLCIEMAYIQCISPMYSYTGAILDINWDKCVVSYMLLFVFLLIHSRLKKNMLTTVYKLLFIMSFNPTLAIFWLKNESVSAMLWIVIYWIFMAIAVYIFQFNCPKANESSYFPSSSSSILNIFFIEAVIVTLYCSWIYGDFRVFINFSDVYTYRLDVSTQMPTILAYLFSWNTIIILPICLTVFLRRKCVFRSALVILLMLMSYAIGGNKVILLYVVLAIGVAILDRLNLNNAFIPLCEVVFSAIMALGTWVNNLFGYKMLIALSDRFLTIPAQAHFYYYDFFQNNPLLLLRQSVLRFLGDPYPRAVSMLIGSNTKYYRTGNYNNMNNGLFSDAYQNFGEIGVLVYPFIIIFTLLLFIKFIHNFDSRFQLTILLCTSMFLYSAYYFSWLLTGGLLFATGMLLLIKKYDARITMGGRVKKIRYKRN